MDLGTFNRLRASGYVNRRVVRKSIVLFGNLATRELAADERRSRIYTGTEKLDTAVVSNTGARWKGSPILTRVCTKASAKEAA